MKMKFSICLTVYNQIDLVRENIQHILSYTGGDIEIVVNDDCSTDNIEALVQSFNDKRIKYFRNQNNVGHDLNILAAFSHCSTNYAFLLRSRDFIIGEKIPKIIDSIERFPQASFYAFSAIDQNMNNVISFSDKTYSRGFNAIIAHRRIFIHPSGMMYNLSYLNIEKLADYIKSHFQDRFGFVIHQLIRAQEAVCGDFVTSSVVIWIYSTKTKLVAVNAAPNRISVYAPLYQYPRLNCEFDYINENISEPFKTVMLKDIIRRYYKSIVYDFKYINKDKRQQSHYNCSEICYNSDFEKKKYIDFVQNLIKNTGIYTTRELQRELKVQSVMITTYYPIKRIIVNVLYHFKVLAIASRIWNRL